MKSVKSFWFWFLKCFYLVKEDGRNKKKYTEDIFGVHGSNFE